MLTLEVLPHYFADLPMFAGVVLANPDPDCSYEGLPYIDPQGPAGPLALEVIGSQGRSARYPDHERARHTEALGLSLGPASSQRYLVDLGHWTRWPAGGYRVRAHYLTPYFDAVSAAVDVSVRATARDDLERVYAMAGPRMADADAWTELVLDGRRAPALGSVSRSASDAIAYPLLLHRVLHGPDSMAELDLHRLEIPAPGPLAPELAAVRYELLRARGDPRCPALRAEILATWPGLAWRLDEADDGEGLLQALRRTYGVESAVPPQQSPYAPLVS